MTEQVISTVFVPLRACMYVERATGSCAGKHRTVLHSGLRIVVVAITWAFLTTCTHGAVHATADRESISTLVVRYSDDAPPQRVGEPPRGVRCVDRRFRSRLTIDRGVGADMYAIRIAPAASSAAATRILRQLGRCPGILWVEAPTVRFLPQDAQGDGGRRTM